MQVLETILYILLFIFCLSVLIAIHECGHLIAAKIFRVYCLEYSIGFGPRFLHVKRKKGETYFSLRIIPFGGFVSMYGEGVELPDGENIPPERSLEGIKKWKRAIILVAGVTMNAILALTIFFVTNIAFENKYVYARQISIAENSVAAEVGLQTGDRIRLYGDIETENDKDERDVKTKFYESGLYYVGVPYEDYAIITTNVDGSESTFAAAPFLYLEGLKNFTDVNYADFLYFYKVEGDVIATTPVEINEYFQSATINLKTIPYVEDEEDGHWDFEHMVDHFVTINKKTTEKGIKLDDGLGVSFLVATEPRMSFFPAIGQSFVDFGNASTAIVKGIASLFYDAKAWKNVGGIVAIGFESTSILKNLGVSRFLQLWGIISVNLAIVNLLPFPGLDGWQLLVLIVEATDRKKIPEKVKNIVSIVGLALLFSLMIVILVFDLIKYVF